MNFRFLAVGAAALALSSALIAAPAHAVSIPWSGSLCPGQHPRPLQLIDPAPDTSWRNALCRRRIFNRASYPPDAATRRRSPTIRLHLLKAPCDRLEHTL